MGIYVLTSAAGSPGVTTTALGMALQWPGEVLLVDADPVGGSPVLAGFYQGQVAHPGTLMGLWDAHRQDRLAQALRELPLQLEERSGFIPGPAGASEALGLRDLWPVLAPQLQELANMEVDVLVDLGRWGHTASALPLAAIADEFLVVLRSDLVSAAAVSAMRLPTDVPAGLVVVGPGRPYSARDIGQVVHLPVRFELPWEPEAAAVLSHGATETKKLRGPSKKLRFALRQGADTLLWRQHQTDEAREEIAL